VYDCDVGHPPGKYNGVYLFNADRSRFNLDGFDWRQVPVDTGSPLSESYGEIENNQPNPVVADVDGDCRKEILFSSYDGRVHCFWLDKTEHYFWPYEVNIVSEGFIRFASEPVVADLDKDGYAEVLFASWVEKGSNSTGKLHILDHRGYPLHETGLPMAHGSPDWNGVLPAPTLGNIDSDEDLEVVLNSAHSGLLAYDLPGTGDARILWGTGRGNFLRNAFVDPDDTPPVFADFDANATEGTEPFAVSFTPECAGCVNAWEWDFGDGGPKDQSSSPVHAFFSVNDQTTSYTVSLTSSNAHESDTAIKTDYIVVHPCSNEPVRIQDNPQKTSETLQDAYDTLAEDGDTIDVQAFEYEGPHDFDRNIFVVVNGGRNCDYNSSKAPSVLHGPVTIRGKGLEIKGTAIQ
jgi:PKD repeat protein